MEHMENIHSDSSFDMYTTNGKRYLSQHFDLSCYLNGKNHIFFACRYPNAQLLYFLS